MISLVRELVAEQGKGLGQWRSGYYMPTAECVWTTWPTRCTREEACVAASSRARPSGGARGMTDRSILLQKKFEGSNGSDDAAAQPSQDAVLEGSALFTSALYYVIDTTIR